MSQPEDARSQMEFADVVELEPVVGDPEYTAWLKAGRPKLDTDPIELDGQDVKPPS